MRLSINTRSELLRAPFPSHISGCSVEIQTVAMMSQMQAKLYMGSTGIRLHPERSGCSLLSAQSVIDTGRWRHLHSVFCRVPAKHLLTDWLLLTPFIVESNDLEYVSTEVQKSLIAHHVSASTTTHKRTESCIHCHSISYRRSAYYRTCFLGKELKQLAAHSPGQPHGSS